MAEPLHVVARDSLSVKLIGLGGVGGIVAQHASMFLASLGMPVRMLAIDGDRFEPHNRTRQRFAEPGAKAEVVAADLRAQFADTLLTVLPVDGYVHLGNVRELVDEGDLVLLCVDNHATRKLVSEQCSLLREVTLVSGGNDGVSRDSSGQERGGTFGTVQVYLRRGGEDVTPSLLRWHPEIAHPADAIPEPGTGCMATAPSQPQLLFANLQVAAVMCQALWLVLCEALPWVEVAFDIREGRMRPIPLARRVAAQA